MPGSDAAPPVAKARIRSRNAGIPSPVSAEVLSTGTPPNLAVDESAFLRSLLLMATSAGRP